MSLLAVDGLTVRFGGRAVVDGVDLHIEEGEVLALLGPSGCGKSTSLRAIAGLQRADEGRIVLEGRSLSAPFVPPERRGVGLVFQDGAVFPHLSVRRNLGFGLQGLPKPERTQRVGELLALLGLDGLGDRMPHQLSGGQRQRVALGRALGPRPRLLLLDEPFASLDAALKVSLREDLFALLRSLRTTALLVTHDQDEALEVADRVAVMHEGRVEQVGTAEAILERPATPFVAGFVGGGALVPVTVEGGCVVWGSQRVPCGRPDGDASLVVRADDLSVGEGWSATATGSRVRGARRATRVTLDGGVAVDVVGVHEGAVSVRLERVRFVGSE